MTARFSTPLLLFHFVLWSFCGAFLLSVSAVFAADHLGPVFPRDPASEAGLTEPLPLPKRNPLLQRPQNRQVIFDDLDPVGSVIPQNLLYEEEFDLQPQIARQQPATSRIPPVIDTNSVIFMDNGEFIQGRIIDDYPFEMETYVSGPFPVAFGMGLFDNITLFSETSTFKTGLNDGSGSLGIAEGVNWSTAVTPQGAVTAQYGVRAVQGDFHSPRKRNQLFMTLGLFKRFDFARVQGGVAVDWLTDRSQFGTHDLRQMRCELSTQILGDLECGFIGGFNVFQDRPAVVYNDVLTFIDVHDYYLLFVRKHLGNGGQLELRCGSTARGDFVMSALGEVAITDRLAVNGGLSMLAPGGRESISGNSRESWAMSMGVVLYFRGGAMFRQTNLHRPMFDVAGNGSFFTRIVP